MTAIEFGFIALPLIGIMIAILQIATTFFTQQALETAAEKGSRLLMTGQVQKAGMSAAAYKTAVCGALPTYMKCANLLVDVNVATGNDFSGATTTLPTITYDSLVGQAEQHLPVQHRESGRHRGRSHDVRVGDPEGLLRLQPRQHDRQPPAADLDQRLQVGELLMPRLSHDRRGTSAIEFAIALPVLILLFTGGFQLSDAVSVYRKVTTTSRALADLTSQYVTVNDAQLDKILAASTQVMAPYSTTDAKLVVSEIKTDAAFQTKVVWSRARNTTALRVGDTVNIPAALKIANTYAIIARVTYTYRPVFGNSYIGTIPMGDTIIMLPRASDSSTRADPSHARPSPPPPP
ncbi:TadE/TadG family type IV pilus assembly protein [Sphingomonas sp. MMS24-JH45]